MKPRSILRTVMTFIAASVTVFFLESTRKANKVYNKPFNLSSETGSFRTSNNFIFFESVSKYLLFSFQE